MELPSRIDQTDRLSCGSSTLRERSVRSVVWVASLQLLLGGLYFGVPFVLTRLVTPAELGLLELTLSVIGLGVVLVELGTGPAVVQRPRLDPAFFSTVFWVNLSSGVLWAVVLGFAGSLVAPLLGGDARLVPLLRGVAVGLVLSAAGIVPQALLVRRMEFRSVTAATALAVAAALSAGSWGLFRHGVSGIVWGFLAFAAVNTTALWLVSRFRPLVGVERDEIVPLLRFGVSASGATAGERVAQQVERSLIAAFLGVESLGLYVLARSLIRDPLRRLMSVFDEILFPALASLQHDRAAAQRYYLTCLRYELAIFGPAVAFVAVFALELTRLLYGPAWQGAALIAQLLALQTWRSVTSHSVGAVFLSQGHPEVRLRWVLISIGLVPLYFFVGRPWGLPGYAASCSVTGLIGWAVSHTMANRLIGLRWPQLWQAIRRPLLAHLLFALLLLALRGATWGLLAGHPARLLLAAVLALPAYAALLGVVDLPLLAAVTRTAAEVFLGRRPQARAA